MLRRRTFGNRKVQNEDRITYHSIAILGGSGAYSKYTYNPYIKTHDPPSSVQISGSEGLPKPHFHPKNLYVLELT